MALGAVARRVNVQAAGQEQALQLHGDLI